MDIFELKLKSSEEQSTVLILELTNRLKSHNHPFTIFSTRTRKRTVHPHHVLSLLTYVHSVLQDTVQTVLFPRNAVKIATGIATAVSFLFVDETFTQVMDFILWPKYLLSVTRNLTITFPLLENVYQFS
jgi:hypothetical protein